MLLTMVSLFIIFIQQVASHVIIAGRLADHARLLRPDIEEVMSCEVLQEVVCWKYCVTGAIGNEDPLQNVEEQHREQDQHDQFHEYTDRTV